LGLGIGPDRFIRVRFLGFPVISEFECYSETNRLRFRFGSVRTRLSRFLQFGYFGLVVLGQKWDVCFFLWN
ncbi:unnamed protein product, partial [Arabidopsis halleri]